MVRRSSRLAAKPRVNYRKLAGLTTRRPKVTKALTSAIKRVVVGQEEKKYCADLITSVNFNSSITSTTEWYNPIPACGPGTLSYQRIGNIIRPTMLDMNWWLSIGNGITRSCDDMVVLYVFKCKNLRSFGDMVNRSNPNLFLDTGRGGGPTAFTGYLNQIDMPLNNELYTLVAKRVVHLQKGTGAQNNDGTTTYEGSNPTNTVKKINIKIRKLPKFHYDPSASTDNLPENYGLCWALGYAKADGSGPDTIFQDIQVNAQFKLYYTDS